MRQVGVRRDPEVVRKPSGTLLAEGARFNEAMSRLSQSTFIPKGVYHFRSHEDANQHMQGCLVRGMGLLAVDRA
ncbi:MAG: hypothetical protein RL020_1863 [Pseudomonadota bacterium]|jgi:hypothetical protein